MNTLKVKYEPRDWQKPWRGGYMNFEPRRGIDIYPQHEIMERKVECYVINWAAYGSVPIKFAEHFAKAMRKAVTKANELSRKYTGRSVD